LICKARRRKLPSNQRLEKPEKPSFNRRYDNQRNIKPLPMEVKVLLDAIVWYGSSIFTTSICKTGNSKLKGYIHLRNGKR
jgi:hypothetical protein